MKRLRSRTQCLLVFCLVALMAGSAVLEINLGRNSRSVKYLNDKIAELPRASAAVCSFYQIWEINDDTTGNSWGDNDHQVDAGETIEMKISLRNTGDENATSVNASIGTIDPTDNNITLIKAEQAVGDITPGGIVTSPDYFIFKVRATCPPNHNISISLDIKADGGLFWNNLFIITVNGAINLTYSSFTVNSESSGDCVADNDLIIDQGENVVLDITLKNLGSATVRSLWGTLTSDDPFVFVNDVYGDFSTIAGNGGVGTGRFGIRVAGDCPDKIFINFNLTATDIDGISWIITFSLLVNGTAVYGITAFTLYQYSGDGDQDLDYGEIWYPSIRISNNGTALGSFVNVTFFSSDPYFSYYYSYSYRNQSFGTIQIGGSYTISYSSVWNFKISQSAPAGHLMVFQVRITDRSNTIGWIYSLSRIIVNGQSPPPGDAGYSSDARNSTATALSLNLEQYYNCYLSANDLVDYFRISVTSSHQYLWIIMSDCYSCNHIVKLYNNNNLSISYSSSTSYGIQFNLNNQVGYFYIKVYASSSYYAGYYSIKTTFTNPNPTTQPSHPSPTGLNGVAIFMLCFLAFIFGIVAIAHYAKPEKRKKAREWSQTVEKGLNSRVIVNSMPSSYLSKAPGSSTTIQDEKLVLCNHDELLQQAANHQATAESYVTTSEYLKAEKEWACALKKSRQALVLMNFSKEKNRINANLAVIEENLVKSIIGQANLAFENAMEYHRKGELIEARAQYQEAVQKYKQGFEKAKNIANHTIELCFSKAEQNFTLCKEYLDQI